MRIVFAIHNALVNVMKLLPVMRNAPAILNVLAVGARVKVLRRLAEKVVTMDSCSFLRLYFS
jgi:hypothetical protein